MRILLLTVTILITNCSANRQYDDYGIKSSEMVLTQNTHSHGWQKTDCFVCHLPNNIHQVDRINDPSFSLAKGMVETYGLQSCSGCHGKNGVQ